MHLTFTMSYHLNEVTFLDVTILRGKGGAIQTRLFRKQTSGNSILHASSFHPHPLITSIQFSQNLRTRRNCSDDKAFQIEAKKLQYRLLERGYSKTCLKRAYKKSLAKTRYELLYSQKSRSNGQHDNTTQLIIPYSNQHNEICKIVQKRKSAVGLDKAIHQCYLAL